MARNMEIEIDENSRNIAIEGSKKFHVSFTLIHDKGFSIAVTSRTKDVSSFPDERNNRGKGISSPRRRSEVRFLGVIIVRFVRMRMN